MNDQFNYKEIAEEQCNRRYHTEMWKDERVQVLKERAELLAENERLRAVVRAAKKFVEHVDSGCGPQCASCRNDDEDCDCGYIELVDAVEALEQKP